MSHNSALVLVFLALIVILSTACTDVRESITGPSAVTGAPKPEQLRQAPVEILDRVTKGRQ